MRVRVLALFSAFVLILPSSINSQQATTASTQASTILAQSLAAMSGSASVSDITLTGAVERIAGSDDETGTVTYRAVPNANRLDLSFSGGVRSEIRVLSANGPGGNWIGPDAVVHEISFHNLFTDPGWFPVFTLGNVVTASNGLLRYVGPETKNGISVMHVQSSQQQSILPASVATLSQHLTQMDFYLNASTLLPVALDFNIHPDNDTRVDIPVEFRFSDYRTVGSSTIPFHVQQFLNGGLFLDVQFQQASVNSGLSSSSPVFAIQ
jgi:hypothetical protein